MSSKKKEEAGEGGVNLRIRFSMEDECFVGLFTPEGGMVHGSTVAEVLREAADAYTLWEEYRLKKARA